MLMDDKLPVLDEKTNPFYSLQHFIIRINFKINDLKNDDPNAIENFAIFLHEYTHYLQTYTTTNGISALLSYIDKLLHMTFDIAINIAMKRNRAKEIIKSYKDAFEVFNKRLNWDRKTRKFPVSLTKPEYIVQTIYNPINRKDSKEIFIYNPTDNLFHHVSTTMLRENMAMMAYFSIRGIGQEAIMDHVKIYPTKENPYSCKYWLLFYYFLYSYPDIKNTVKFTYYFCELSLMVITTGEFIEKLLNDIKYLMKKEKYIDENIFFDKLWEMQIDIISKNGNVIVYTEI